MKSLLILLSCIFIFYSCSNEKNKYLKEYPWFTHADVFTNTKTVSLNSFKTRKNKNGLEYLLDIKGQILEVRSWKNNHINGNSILYATNSSPYIIACFKNDTMNGNYFELDTLNGGIVFWAEKQNKNGVVYDNNYIKFKNNKIDFASSSFYSIKKINDSIVSVSLPCRYPFPFTKVIFTETDDAVYEFNGSETEINSNDGIHYYYKINSKNKKYVVGSATYYRLSKGENDTGVTGRVIYFKITTK